VQQFRGEPRDEPEHSFARQTLYAVDSSGSGTMMQSCASVCEGSREVGPFYNGGAKDHVPTRVPTTSDRYRQFVVPGRRVPKLFVIATSLISLIMVSGVGPHPLVLRL